MHVDLLTYLCIKFDFELLSIRHIVTNYFAMLLRYVIATNERLTQLLTAEQPPFFKPQGSPLPPIPKKLCHNLNTLYFYTNELHYTSNACNNWTSIYRKT